MTGTPPIIGGSSQYTAVARFSDGTNQTVTSQAGWQSSNLLVATVNSSGTVTAVGAGEVDVQATFEGMAGSAHLRIEAPRTYTISGSITDESTGGVLPGIVVRIDGGANSGQATRSLADGTYSLSGLSAGSISLVASANSYVTVTKSVTVDADLHVDFVMPRPPNLPPFMPPPTYTMAVCGATGPISSSGYVTLRGIFAQVSPPPAIGTNVRWKMAVAGFGAWISPSAGTDAAGTAAFPVTTLAASIGIPVGTLVTMTFYFDDQTQFGTSTCDVQFLVQP